MRATSSEGRHARSAHGHNLEASCGELGLQFAGVKTRMRLGRVTGGGKRPVHLAGLVRAEGGAVLDEVAARGEHPSDAFEGGVQLVVVEVVQHRLGDGGLQPGCCHGQVAQVGAQQPDPLVLAVAAELAGGAAQGRLDEVDPR